MKKPIVCILILGAIILSCSNHSEDFEREAKELCSCMEEGETDAEDASTASLNIGFCLIDAKVNLKAPEMKEEINKQCPQFNEGFEEFVKDLK